MSGVPPNTTAVILPASISAVAVLFVTPPPLNVIAGVAIYPLPASTILNDKISEILFVAVAVAPVPLPPLTVTVGTFTYPEPPSVTVIPLTKLLITADAVAVIVGLPPLTVIVGILV